MHSYCRSFYFDIMGWDAGRGVIYEVDTSVGGKVVSVDWIDRKINSGVRTSVGRYVGSKVISGGVD